MKKLHYVTYIIAIMLTIGLIACQSANKQTEENTDKVETVTTEENVEVTEETVTEEAPDTEEVVADSTANEEVTEEEEIVE